jgi:hypothetical protein
LSPPPKADIRPRGNLIPVPDPISQVLARQLLPRQPVLPQRIFGSLTPTVAFIVFYFGMAIAEDFTSRGLAQPAAGSNVEPTTLQIGSTRLIQGMTPSVSIMPYFLALINFCCSTNFLGFVGLELGT